MEAMVVEGVIESLRIGVGFLWTAAWAIIMGLTITSLVQVYVSKERMARVLGEGDLNGLTKATVFGAASSGCSFRAVAIGKGLFKKGAHAVNFLAFMFASTNLIVELGLMILILLGWEFLVAELLGGVILIAIMAVIVHLTLPENLFSQVRETLNERDRESGVTEDPTCGIEGKDEFSLVTDGGETLKFCSEGCMETYRQQTSSSGDWRDELQSWVGWYKVGNQYRKEWSMIWKDIVAGFLISGFVIVFVPQWVWNTLFIQGDGLLVTAENAIMGVAIAVISFVGSMGNVPFAVALWGGGIYFLVRGELTDSVKTDSAEHVEPNQTSERMTTAREYEDSEVEPSNSRSDPQARVLDLLPNDERRVLEPVLNSPGITQIELRDRSEFSKSKVSQTASSL